MSDWAFNKKSIYQECLNSKWFIKVLQELSNLVPFPFLIKNEESVIYSNVDLNQKIDKEIKLGDSCSFTLGIPERIYP